MKIISLKKDNWSNRYIIVLENDEIYKVSIEIIVKYNLKQDMDIDYDFITNMVAEEDEKEAFNKSLDMITVRDHSSFEIKNKLLKKGYNESTIELVLLKLSEYNFINDKKYADNFLKYSEKYKKHGKNKIIFNLKQKGISSNIISGLEFDEDIEYEVAKTLCDKKLRTLGDDDKKKEKLYRYLCSRGFSQSMVIKIIQGI